MNKRNPLIIVFAIIFLDMLGVGVLIPVIPLLLGDPASSYYLLPPGWSIQQGYILLGLLTGIYPLMQFFATPILGQLSDKFGRKKILLFSLVGTLLGYLLFAYAILIRNIPLLFASRALDGLTGGNISVAQAVIADSTPPEKRARSFGMIGAAFGLGFIFGPYLGGKLSDPGILSWFTASTPFWFAAMLTSLNCLAVLFILPETHLSRDRNRPMEWKKALTNIRSALLMKKERHLFLSSFLFQGGFTFFTTFFGVYLINKFNFTQGNIGDFFAVVGIWIVIGQAVVVRMVAKRFKESSVLRVSLAATGVALLLYLLPNASWQLDLIVPFFAIFNGLTQANLSGLVSRSVGPEMQGRVLGILSGVQALAMAIPPMLSGLVAASIGPYAPIVISGIIIISSGVIYNLMANRKEKAITG
jgi:DHA1 family tetracycline resistance protein-like MFS transporter